MTDVAPHATSIQPDEQSGASAGGDFSATVASSDADLLSAIGRGNEPAFEELRDRYRRAVDRACRSIAGFDLEDCAQEVFVRVWRKARLYDRRRGSAPAWLLTLARRVALTMRQARKGPAPVELLDHADTVDPPSVDRLWIAGALDRLPQRERSVIELAYFDDLSQSAIAAQLDVPLGTVKSWTRRGLKHLATELEESRSEPRVRPEHASRGSRSAS